MSIEKIFWNTIKTVFAWDVDNPSDINILKRIVSQVFVTEDT